MSVPSLGALTGGDVAEGVRGLAEDVSTVDEARPLWLIVVPDECERLLCFGNGFRCLLIVVECGLRTRLEDEQVGEACRRFLDGDRVLTGSGE